MACWAYMCTLVGARPIVRRYFVWDWPDASEDYATEAEVWAALALLVRGG